MVAYLFIPHIYINGWSPFRGFDENEIFYHGGTAVAIQAGLLSRDEIRISIERMQENVKLAGAQSIGLTLYPPYPEKVLLPFHIKMEATGPGLARE